MHSQLNYIIAKQRHAELVQNAQPRTADRRCQNATPKRQPTTALRSFGGRITAAVVHRSPSAARDAS